MQNPFVTPSSTCLSEDLLFFDTFSHSGSEKDNFDLVQFPSPVIIDLIKIVPLGQPIEAKIPGNVRLGATNPSKCELEFFINDLSKQDAHTMTDMGRFYCSEKETDFNPPIQVQTDGLLLRGSYRTLTLAIFGQIATYDDKIDDEQVVLSALSPPAQTPASPVASERDNLYLVRPVDQELIRRANDESESYDESTLKSGELIAVKDESLAGNAELMDERLMDIDDAVALKERVAVEDMSGSEIGGYLTRDKKLEETDYSSVEADNYFKRKDESTRHPDELDIKEEEPRPERDNLEEEANEWSFDADSYRPEVLLYFPDPSLTTIERSITSRRVKLSCSEFKESVDKEVEKVKEMFDGLNCTNDRKTEEWVVLVEELTTDIANMSLSRTITSETMLRFLIDQVSYGLDFSSALRQKQTGFRVRHLRAGIKLATILFQCGESAVSALLEASIPQKVLKLYDIDQMSLPIRLLIFKCLNAVCDNIEGIQHVVTHKYDWEGVTLSICNIKEKLGKESCKRIKSEKEDNETKSESVPTDDRLQLQRSEELKLSNHKASSSSPVKTEQDTNSLSITCYQFMILALLSQPTTRVTMAIGSLMKKIRLYQDLSQLASIRPDEPEESEDSVAFSEKICQTRGQQLEQTLLIIQDIVSLTKDSCVEIAQPVRYLPAKIQFQFKPNLSDTSIAVFKWVKHFNTLDCLDSLLNIPSDLASDSRSTIETEQSIKIQNLCLLLLQQLIDSPRGAQFFLSHDCFESTGNILKTMSRKQLSKRPNLRVAEGIENLNDPHQREESLLAARCHEMSLRLSYFFKVFSCIDLLFHFHRELLSKRGESSLCNPEMVLHHLYIISDHPYGLAAMVKHFSSVGNLDCLLRFIDLPEHHKQLEFVKETSIDYTLELVGTILRLNNNVLELADEYLDTLNELCKTKDKTLSARIKSLLPWLTPFDTDQSIPIITYSEETFRQLTRVIRKSIPNYSIPFAKELDFELPPQMITAVRILRQLCIPPQVETFIEANFDLFSAHRLDSNLSRLPSFMAFVDSRPQQQNHNQSWNLNLQPGDNLGISIPCDDPDQLGQISNTFKLFQPYDESICGELKYHYGIMQIYEHEGLRRLLNTLRELTGNYPRPIYQSAALSGFRGRIVISYIHSVIILLHSITCHLIDARGSDFKDTSIIPVILETYSLLCFVPKPERKISNDNLKHDGSLNAQASISLKSDNYQMAQQTKKLILSILMSFTQMCLSVSESEEKVISKSIWTKMLKEVIDFTLSTPVFFHHGLDVLTKILPSPLPCSSIMDSIDQEQLFKNINHRKLWSAHLHPLHQQLEQMISHLSICYHSNIRTLLYYLCNQLCDLSSNAACIVAKIITDTLITCAAKLSLGTNNASPEHGQNLHQSQQAAITNVHTISGVRENAYAVKMTLNLLSNLITNQAFETAFSNHLQIISKKDEKLLANLQNTLELHEDYRPGELVEDAMSSNANNCVASVSHLIELIKTMNSNLNKNGYQNPNSEPPPEELTKINLQDVARKTSDRFSLTTGLKETYRLKVLLDLNARAQGSNDSTSSKKFGHAPYNYQDISLPSSHKPYIAPVRGRGRSSSRPDSFRSRPQNTSRPPSIHVDDFIDIYGDNSAQTSSSRYAGASKSSSDYRNSHPSQKFQTSRSRARNNSYLFQM